MKPFLSTDEILGVLHGFNPWWEGRDASIPPFRRIAYYKCREYLEHPQLKRAVMLSGPRRVGKSVILQQVAGDKIQEGMDPKALLYLSLEHPLLKMLSLSDILKIYHAHISAAGRPTTLLLDEIHYSPDWEIQLKLLVDHKPEYRILCTGSATLATKEALSESGTGRWVTVNIPTLSFYEFLRIREEGVTPEPEFSPRQLLNLPASDRVALASLLRPTLPLFHRYLLLGGFPETAKLDDVALAQRLLREDVVDRVLKRDMTALFGVRNVAELERLFIYLCMNTGGIFQAKTCADQLEVGASTVAKHLDYLEQAHLVYRIEPFARGGKLILKGRPKIHLVDAAIRNAVLLKGETILQDPRELGIVVESTILRHILAFQHRQSAEVTYWRDAKTQKEVDIILSTGGSTIPFEVKYRDSVAVNAKDGIAIFCEKEGLDRAYLITRNDTDFGPVTVKNLATQFMKIPAHIFAFVSGRSERANQGL